MRVYVRTDGSDKFNLPFVHSGGFQNTVNKIIFSSDRKITDLNCDILINREKYYDDTKNRLHKLKRR